MGRRLLNMEISRGTGRSSSRSSSNRRALLLLLLPRATPIRPLARVPQVVLPRRDTTATAAGRTMIPTRWGAPLQYWVLTVRERQAVWWSVCFGSQVV